MSTDTGFRDELPGVDRLLTLSDGVVAIAITLLVLQLNVPEPAKLTAPASASELATELGKGADSLISYVISFYVIAQFWLVHHRSSAGSPDSERVWPGGTSRSCSPLPSCLSLAISWASSPPIRSPSTSSRLTCWRPYWRPT